METRGACHRMFWKFSCSHFLLWASFHFLLASGFSCVCMSEQQHDQEQQLTMMNLIQQTVNGWKLGFTLLGIPGSSPFFGILMGNRQEPYQIPTLSWSVMWTICPSHHTVCLQQDTAKQLMVAADWLCPSKGFWCSKHHHVGHHHINSSQLVAEKTQADLQLSHLDECLMHFQMFNTFSTNWRQMSSWMDQS